MEWVLYLAEAMNSPDGAELARYETEEKCQRAAMTVWLTGDAVAKMHRGENEASDLYGICRHKDDLEKSKRGIATTKEAAKAGLQEEEKGKYE